MHFIRTIALIIVLLCTVGTLQGTSAAPSTHSFKDPIKYLINMIGVDNEYVRFLSYMKVYPPEDAKMKILYNELFSFDSYISDLSTIYAKYYTIDDVLQMVNFYSTPLGKKTIQLNHDLNPQMEDIMLTKISDYIFTSSEHGFDILLPEIPY